MDSDKIYTSYFAQIRNMPDNFEPIAISKAVPDWYEGKRYEDLAPTVYLIAEAHKKNYGLFESEYTKQLSDLDVDEVVENLLDLAGDKVICLVCYEKYGEFCHRTFVRDWLVKNGYPCEEFDINKFRE